MRIKDNGKGIKKEHLPNIFKPYYTTRSVIGGTGLGLAISKEIVEEHNGTITVESTSSKGTTFLVRFPLLQPVSKSSSAGFAITDAVLELVKEDSLDIYERVGAEYKENPEDVSGKFEYLFKQTIKNLYEENVDLNDYTVELHRAKHYDIGSFKTVYVAHVYSKDSNKLQYEFVLKTPKTANERCGVRYNQPLIEEYYGMKEIAALFTNNIKNTPVPVIGEIVDIDGINFLTQEWINAGSNTYDDLLQKWEEKEVGESLISKASQQILALSIAVWFKSGGKFIDGAHPNNFVFYGNLKSGLVGKPSLVDVDEMEEFTMNELIINLRTYLFKIRDLDHLRSSLRDMIGNNEKADKIYERFDKLLFSSFVKTNNLLVPKETSASSKIREHTMIEHAKNEFLLKLLGTDAKYAQNSKVGKIVKLLSDTIMEEDSAIKSSSAGRVVMKAETRSDYQAALNEFIRSLRNEVPGALSHCRIFGSMITAWPRFGISDIDILVDQQYFYQVRKIANRISIWRGVDINCSTEDDFQTCPGNLPLERFEGDGLERHQSLLSNDLRHEELSTVAKSSSAGESNVAEKEIIVRNPPDGIHGQPARNLSLLAALIKWRGLNINIDILNLRTTRHAPLIDEFDLMIAEIKDGDRVKLSAKGPYNQDILNKILVLVGEFMRDKTALESTAIRKYVKRIRKIATENTAVTTWNNRPVSIKDYIRELSEQSKNTQAISSAA